MLKIQPDSPMVTFPLWIVHCLGWVKVEIARFILQIKFGPYCGRTQKAGRAPTHAPLQVKKKIWRWILVALNPPPVFKSREGTRRDAKKEKNRFFSDSNFG
jgi:hypothetical protein